MKKPPRKKIVEEIKANPEIVKDGVCGFCCNPKCVYLTKEKVEIRKWWEYFYSGEKWWKYLFSETWWMSVVFGDGKRMWGLGYKVKTTFGDFFYCAMCFDDDLSKAWIGEFEPTIKITKPAKLTGNYYDPSDTIKEINKNLERIHSEVNYEMSLRGRLVRKVKELIQK